MGMNVAARAAEPDAMQARFPELERLAALALDTAKGLGASAAAAEVQIEQGLSVSVRLRELETLEHQRDQGLSVTVYRGHAKGNASVTDMSDAAVAQAVAAADRIARLSEADEYAGLADAARMATEFPDLDLYHPWDLSAADAIALAQRMEAAALDFDPRVSNSEGATVGTHHGISLYANSHGFVGRRQGGQHMFSCSVLAGQDDGMQRDYWFQSDRVVAALPQPEAIGQRAAERAVARLGARQVPTARGPVLFDPAMAKGLVRSFFGAMSGSAQYRHSSFLLGKAAAPVFPSFLQIDEQPHLPRAAGSAAFDAEGVATEARRWVDAGVATGYVLDSYAARRLGLESTGNAGGLRNLRVAPGGEAGDLIARLGTGLLVTEMMGQGANAVTGDYSRGASGFWVENGERAYPVEEITIAGNLVDMFKNVVAIGTDVDTRGNIHTGSWLVDGLTIAGA